MWIMLKDAFFSAVDKAKTPGCLVVRARRQGDLERYFPGAAVQKTVGNDYLFRAEIPREEVARVLTEYVMNISASNFKDSVADDKLHDAYMGVWHIMARLQPIAPYARPGRGQGALL
mgnify:CR=1 FL=1